MTLQNIPHHLVTAIDHVGIAIPDLDEALAWYKNNLGMVATHIEVNEEQGVKEAMVAPVDGKPGCTQIQLLAPLHEDTTIGKFLSKKGPGLQQMCVRTTDIEALCNHLREQGVRLLYPEPKVGTAGALINFIHPKDAHGVLLEITQPKV